MPVVYVPAITVRQPDGSVVVRAGKPEVLRGDDEITTRQAAGILDCSIDWVARMCDQGRLIEGRDWKRVGKRGNYRIKRASIMNLRAGDLV